MRPLLIAGAVISPINSETYEIIPNALLQVDDHGNIQHIHSVSSTLPIEKAIQSFLLQHRHISPHSLDIIRLDKGEFLIPGFIDTHTHAPQVPITGAGQQYELLDWLKNLTYPMEARFKDGPFATKVYRKVVKRFIDAGTTTCCYYGSVHLEATKILSDIVHGYGQRGFVGKCNMNQECPDDYRDRSPEISIAETEKLIAYIRSLSPDHHSRLVHPVLTPRFAISCSHDLMTSLGTLADSDPKLAIQTHISENQAEVEYAKGLYKNLGPDVTYAGIYDHYGLLRGNTILAHAVHLTDAEMDLIKKRDTGISHCPTSNFNLTSGIARVGLMLEKGIKVGLGTDVSGGFSPSMLTAIQHASIASKMRSMDPDTTLKKLSIPTLFYLATLGGARVCNLEHQIGSLEVGKAFDALVVNVRNSASYVGSSSSSATNFKLWSVDDDDDVGLEHHKCKEDVVGHDGGHDETHKEELDAMLQRFLFCGDDRNIRRVYVQGKWIGGAERRHEAGTDQVAN